MNYLAHAMLAEPTDEARLGSLLGDFRRGLVLSALPPDAAYAVREHAALDAHFDGLEEVRALRRSFPPHLLRFAGVLIDVFVDHALVLDWEPLVRGAGGPTIEAVTSSVYRGLERHAALLPPRLAAIAPRMERDDWLGSYGDLENIERALHGIAARLKRETRLAEGIDVLRARGPEFRSLAARTIPKVRTWLDTRRRADGRGA